MMRRPCDPRTLGLTLAAMVLLAETGAGVRAGTRLLPPLSASSAGETLTVDQLSPAFLGMYRKLQLIEPEIRRHCERYGVDVDLARAVCLYESGANPGLTSTAGAQGYFQVMPATFRMLKVESNIEAGVKYLAEMLRRFEREDYAVAAYNAGPGGVARSRPMPLETLQYVLGVGHYRTVLKLYDPALRHHVEEIELTRVGDGEDWLAIARRLDLPLLQLRLHNPFLASRPLRPGALVAYPRTPRVGLVQHVDGQLEYLTRHGDNYLTLAFSLDVDLPSLRAANGLWHLQSVPAGMRLRIPVALDAASRPYTVRSGDDLRTIAAATGVDAWRILRDNGLMGEERIAPGTVLRVRRAGTTPAAPAGPASAGPAAATDTVHRVQRGDTLSTLAKRYRTSVAALQSLNRMNGSTRLRIGQRLLVPTGPDRHVEAVTVEPDTRRPQP